MNEDYIAGVTFPNAWPTENDYDGREAEVRTKC